MSLDPAGRTPFSPGGAGLSEPPAACALTPFLARLDALLGAAVRVAAERFGTPPTADLFRGLYVSDADAVRLVERGIEPLAGALVFDPSLVDLEAAGPAWRILAQAFALRPVELDIIALSLAVDVDLRYERVFGYLHDDVTRRRPTVDLVLQLLTRSFEERLATRRLFAPDAPLIRFGLVRLVPDSTHPEPSLIGQALRVEDDVLEFLLGRPELDHRVAGACRWDLAARSRRPSPRVRSLADRLARLAGESDGAAPVPVILTGPNERDKLDVAAEVGRRLEMSLLVVDLERLAQSETPWPSLMLLVGRTIRLRRALPLWIRGDTLNPLPPGGSELRLDAWLSTVAAMHPPLALLATLERNPQYLTGVGPHVIRLDFPLPDSRTRGMLWADSLAPHGMSLDPADTDLLAEAYRFDAGAIERAAERAVTQARWRAGDGARPECSDVFTGARTEAARVLPRYATRLEGAFGWDDLVLPADQLRQLRELCGRVSHRQQVLEDWGFAGRLPLGTGVSALFAGPPGTGKTMAAQVIASALGGIELYRVEIPAVVSKYIGETEKALDQLFREAQGTSAILFFDEADALFGRRTEVKDAHDRYANIEVAYLLQALEAYEGLTILATNFQHNLDEAFVRRLAFIVNFPYPEEPERRAIWQRSWPGATPLEDLDLAFLARQFKLTGGDIRNVALSAAFAAAANGGRVTMKHVFHGIRREYQKLGRVFEHSELGPYAELAPPEGVP